MIDYEKYKILREKGLLLDHYYILSKINENPSFIKENNIEGIVNFLRMKGYVKDLVITDEGYKLLSVNPKDKPSGNWIFDLHKKCEDKIFQVSGKKQKRVMIQGSVYSFLPNYIDFEKVLNKVITLYKIKDVRKVESTILGYIDRCIQRDSWTPLLGYYIMKNSLSPMVTDMNNNDDFKEEDSTINI